MLRYKYSRMIDRDGKSPKPKGNSKSALVIIDFVTDFDFEDGEMLFKHARPAAKRLSQLKQRANKAKVPIIYINDNYGKWQTDFEHQAKDIEEYSPKGRQIIELLRPEKDDYYVLKPQRSGFYETPLAVLLEALGVSKLVISGLTTDICVLFTAHDAYMRGFEITIASDCCAAVKPAHHRTALELMKRVAEAAIMPASRIRFGS